MPHGEDRLLLRVRTRSTPEVAPELAGRLLLAPAAPELAAADAEDAAREDAVEAAPDEATPDEAAPDEAAPDEAEAARDEPAGPLDAAGVELPAGGRLVAPEAGTEDAVVPLDGAREEAGADSPAEDPADAAAADDDVRT